MEKVRPWCGQPSDGGRLKNVVVVVSITCSGSGSGVNSGSRLRSTAGSFDVTATSAAPSVPVSLSLSVIIHLRHELASYSYDSIFLQSREVAPRGAPATLLASRRSFAACAV